MSEIDVSLVTGESTGIDISLSSSAQTIGVDITDGGFVLTPATKNSLGGVIVGDNINVTSNGTISVPDASTTTKGVIEIATDEESSAGESETLAVTPKQLSTKQDTLVSGTNIKTINNTSILGSGNITIEGSSGFLPFPESWPTSSSYTTKQFCDAVNADSSAVVGMAYLGEVYFSDLSTVSLVNSEITVEIMSGTTSMDKVILLRMTSGNHAPYQWQYTYWNAGSNVSGWIGFQPELPTQSGNNGKFLTTNGSNLSWGDAPVTSVNSKTGAVSLSASDVSALPDSTHIPADPVQSNWNEENTESLAYIQNKPTIPAAQVNSDWNANSGVAEILNKPSLAAVATSGAYSDLTGTPTIPTVGNGTITIAQGGVSKGTFTVNQSGDTTINLDSGGGGGTDLPDQTGHSGEFLTTNGTAASWAAAPVTSVNNKTGAVTLTATDVGALPDSTIIPAAQVNSDWNSTSGVSEILNKPSLATVATSGSYTDLSNKPSIPAAQVNSDWDAVSGIAQILNKPTLATVATSGSYNDLSNKPTIPTVNNATLTIQKNGTTVKTFTANASTDVTANITVPTDTSDLSNGAGFITGISSGDVTTALGYTPVNPSSLATVATSGSYADLSNKPSIPAAQVNSDWNAVSGVAQILNKPSLAAVATSGAYSDLTGTPTIPAAQVNSDWNATSGVAEILNKPTIPTVNDATLTITQGGVSKGTFTANASSDVTIALDAGSSLPSQSGNSGKFLTTDGTDASWASVPKEVEWAIYGTTTFQQISDWYNAGKMILCFHGDVVYGLTNINTTYNYAYFASLNRSSNNVFYYEIGLSNNSWSTTTKKLQNQIDAGTAGQAITYTGTAGTIGSADISHRVIEVQAPTSQNNYTWYRKYADGWVEQGGIAASRDETITLPVAMADANYIINTDVIGTVEWHDYGHSINTVTTTGFKCYYDGEQTDPSGFYWEVKGVAASI